MLRWCLISPRTWPRPPPPGAAAAWRSAAPGGAFALPAGPRPAPESWQLSRGARYVHICSNETIHGVEFQELPDLKALGCDAPLVVDFSSHVASRPVDWSRVGLAFGGAQKNLGPAGLTLVIVREDLLGHALPACPSAFDYKTVADNQSRSEEHTSELQSPCNLVCRLLLEKKK